jgi:arylsulfatase A-like enzyme
MPEPVIGDWAQADDPERNGWIVDCHAGRVSGEALRRARAAYYALITQIDTQVQRLRQALEEYDLLTNTVFIFASDHGEMLGDHNLFRKCLPYDASARVPLIVALPRRFGLQAGVTVDAPVELRDIMPTFLEAAGVPIPVGIEGQSLLSLARGQSPAWRDHLHGEHAAGTRSNHWITDGKMMYVWFSQDGREQLFDLVHDPRNSRDLAALPAHRDQKKHFRQLLIGELAGREEGYSDGRQLVVGRTPQAVLAPLRETLEG